MKAVDRENMLYGKGKRNKLDIEEQAMFGLLGMPSEEALNVLDIGCGTGDVAEEIERLGFCVTGVDFSEVAVETAQARGVVASKVDLDEGLPFNDKSFDLIWAGDIIEHVFDPIFVLQECRRVLRPNGRMLVTVPYDMHIVTRIKTLFGISYQEKVYKKLGQYKHHTFFSMSLFSYMVNVSDFRISKVKIKTKRIPLINKSYIFDGTWSGIILGDTVIALLETR